jgi:effector-binding domain-containing protein
MIDTPQIAQSTAQKTAVIHLTIPREEIQTAMGPAIGEVMAAVAAQGINPSGPLFSYHLRMDPATFNFEVGVPVPSPVTATGRVKMSELPAGRVARTVYLGGYEGLGAAWGEFDAWLEAEGHKASGGLWEFYVAGPESSPDSSTWRTELNRPIED